MDTVNNVENVFLTPSYGINSQLSTNYSITVVGRRVNVNAVTAQTNNVCQDYALVISSGDGLPHQCHTRGPERAASSRAIWPLVTVITNSFVNSPDFDGGILCNQRVGANPQLLGHQHPRPHQRRQCRPDRRGDQPMAFLRHHQ